MSAFAGHPVDNCGVGSNTVLSYSKYKFESFLEFESNLRPKRLQFSGPIECEPGSQCHGQYESTEIPEVHHSPLFSDQQCFE